MNEEKESIINSDDNEVYELTSDIEVLGPGKILSDARKVIGLSQQDIATQLNFHLSLVKNIEDENFDKNLPDTYLRGYLRSFAKLVNVSEQDILASYEVLGVAEEQCAEMQSFSQSTKKQAEHSRLMWISYLMLTILLGSTVYWFFQESVLVKEAVTLPDKISSKQEQASHSLSDTVISERLPQKNVLNKSDVDSIKLSNISVKNIEQVTTELVNDSTVIINENVENVSVTTTQQANELSHHDSQKSNEDISVINKEITLKSVQFTFSDDCWVNIYDATGERVAWGVKKKGYIMNFKGVAPFNVTLGKPEFVSITYENSSVALSQFTAGNIAKFTLPLTTN